jgi:cytochrome P450/NADPH-cytochrome P450 reductase
LQNFDVQMDDPTYQLQIKQTLTVKPKDFYIKARVREGINPTELDRIMHSGLQSTSSPKALSSQTTASDIRTPMSIFYGYDLCLLQTCVGRTPCFKSTSNPEL